MPLLSFVILSKAEKWVRYVSYPLLCIIALSYFLDFMAQGIICDCKHQTAMHFFFIVDITKGKFFFLSTLLVILANIMCSISVCSAYFQLFLNP